MSTGLAESWEVVRHQDLVSVSVNHGVEVAFCWTGCVWEISRGRQIVRDAHLPKFIEDDIIRQLNFHDVMWSTQKTIDDNRQRQFEEQRFWLVAAFVCGMILVSAALYLWGI